MNRRLSILGFTAALAFTTVTVASCGGEEPVRPVPVPAVTETPSALPSPSSSQPSPAPISTPDWANDVDHTAVDDGFAGGGTNAQAHLTVERGGYFLVPLPGGDITAESVADDPGLVDVAVFDAMPTWEDGLPARAVNSPASAYWQAGEKAGKTTITTTFTKGGKRVTWTLDVTVE